MPSSPADTGSSYPTTRVRTWISLAVIVHLLAIAVSFLATVEPSTTHLTLDALFSPYLRATHFGADRRAVYLAHGEAAEQPLRLQIRRSGSSENRPGANRSGENRLGESGGDEPWETIGPTGTSGLAVADRYSRWLATIVQLAESDQSGLAAALLLPQLQRMVDESDPDQPPMRQVRIVRLPTELTTVVEDALPPPYVAEVVQRAERLDLVQVRQPRLNAFSTGGPDGTTNGLGQKQGEADE